MAFVWGIDPDAEIEIAVTSNNRECVAQIAIGYDDETNDTISVFTALSPLPTGDYEHVFSIIDADPSSGGEYNYWDGDQTKNLFNKEDRAYVLAIICAATNALIADVRPRCVLHATHTPNLPLGAIRKHQVIMGVFRDSGYEVKLAKPYHGRQAWEAELPATQ